MKVKPIAQSDKKRKSQLYYAKYSQSKLSHKYQIHTFQTHCPVSSLLENNDIKIVKDFPEHTQWGFENSLQRNVNEQRAASIAQNYLLEEKDIKLFPPITVVLLPFRDGKPQPFYANEPKESEELNSILGLEVEGLSAPEKENAEFHIEPFCNIRWETDLLTALTIDGQHRVRALRIAHSESRNSISADITIPVIILVLDPSNSKSLIESARELFIDVNNTPKLVSEERLIFLDDRNVIRTLTRSLIKDNSKESDEVLSWTKEMPSIPYEALKIENDDKGKESRGTPPLGGFPLLDIFVLYRIIKTFLFEDWSYPTLPRLLDSTLKESLFSELENKRKQARKKGHEDLESELKSLVDDAFNTVESYKEQPNLKPVYLRYIDYVAEVIGFEESEDENSREDDRDPEWFSFEQRTCKSIVLALESSVTNRLVRIFFSQLWVKNVIESMNKSLVGNDEFESYLKLFLRARTQDVKLKFSDFIDKSVSSLDREKVSQYQNIYNKLEKEIFAFEGGSESRNCGNNILRYSVGQRMYLSLFTELEELTQKPESQSLDWFTNKMNSLEERGFFQQNAISKLPNKQKHFVWEKLLVNSQVTDTNEFSFNMRPSDGDARVARDFMFFVLRGVSRPEDATGKKSEFKRVAKKIGSFYVDSENFEAAKELIPDYLHCLSDKEQKKATEFHARERRVSDHVSSVLSLLQLIYGCYVMESIVSDWSKDDEVKMQSAG